MFEKIKQHINHNPLPYLALSAGVGVIVTVYIGVKLRPQALNFTAIDWVEALNKSGYEIVVMNATQSELFMPMIKAS